MNRYLIAFIVLLPVFAFAGEDQDSYCKYVLEQGAAQRDFLRSPSATSGIVQPNTGLPAQMLWGASISLANIKKAGFTMDVARKNCELYRSTTATQQQLQYALPALEKSALQNRLALVAQASEQLDAMIVANQKLVEAQNATVPMLYALHSVKVKLFKDRADIELQTAMLYTPDIQTKPVREALVFKQGDEVANQKAIERLTQQNNWDVTFEAGARHQLAPFFANGVGPYVTFSLTYNLANKAIDQHLAAAVSGYASWKLTQEGDVVKNASILKKQVSDSVAVEESQLIVLQQEADDIESNLKIVANVETSAALSFKNQLLTDRLMLRIELGDATFRLEQLRNYLTTNF